MSVLDGLLPSSVAVEELWEHPADLGLFPGEAASVSRAVEKRQREFAAVRRCARAALTRLELPPAAILPGKRGEPVWPPGVVGSMTHCTGYAAAALAMSDDIAGLGVDAEPHGPLPDGVLDLTSLPGERARIARLTDQDPGTHWDRLMFSMKEAVYKTWFPLTRRWLDFTEAETDVDPERRTFCARLLIPGPIVDGVRCNQFAGRWTIADGIVVTAIALCRNDP